MIILYIKQDFYQIRRNVLCIVGPRAKSCLPPVFLKIYTGTQPWPFIYVLHGPQGLKFLLSDPLQKVCQPLYLTRGRATAAHGKLTSAPWEVSPKGQTPSLGSQGVVQKSSSSRMEECARKTNMPHLPTCQGPGQSHYQATKECSVLRPARKHQSPGKSQMFNAT